MAGAQHGAGREAAVRAGPARRDVPVGQGQRAAADRPADGVELHHLEWRRGNIKRFPHVETLYRLSDVMGIDRSRLLAVAGMIGEIGEETLRTETASGLTPREARLISAFRQLSEGYQSIVFSQVTAMVHAQD